MEPESAQQAEIYVWLKRPGVVIALVAATCIVLYINTLAFDFVWDDHTQVVSNQLIRSWRAVPQMFFTHLWSEIHAAGNYYRPFFLVWSTLVFTLGGVNPVWWHLATVLLHAGASCLVYLLARKVNLDHWGAAIASLVFAVHPVHVEVAAWVSAGADSLATVLFLLAILFLLRARDEYCGHRVWARFVSLVMAALAMFTKEMGMTLAPVVFACVWFGSRRTGMRARSADSIREALPYFTVTLACLWVRSRALHGVAPSRQIFNWREVLLTWPSVLVEYLRSLIAPMQLNGSRYTPYVTDALTIRFALSAVGCIAAVLVLWWWSRRTHDRSIKFLGWWMLLCLTPALYLPAFRAGDFVRDRYVYLSSVAFCILLGKAIRYLPSIGRLRTPFAVQLLVTTATVTVLAAASMFQQVYWSEDIVVFARSYTLSPQSRNAVHNYANELASRGDFDHALRVVRSGLKQYPLDPELHFVLATVYSRMGKKAEAYREIQFVPTEGIEIPASDKTDMATMLSQLGDYATALRLYHEVLAQFPENFPVVYNCGVTYYHLRQYSEAERMLARAVQIDPYSAQAHMYLGSTLIRMNRMEDAETHLTRAVELAPGDSDYHVLLGVVLLARGQAGAARQQFEQGLRLNPENSLAQALLTRNENNQAAAPKTRSSGADGLPRDLDVLGPAGK